MEKGPQYISSIWIVDNISIQYGNVSTIYSIRSIWKSVHNTLVQYGKRSTIHKFNFLTKVGGSLVRGFCGVNKDWAD